MNGRLLPLGWWHFLRRERYIDRVRVGFLGVHPEHQHTGVAASLYIEHYDMAAEGPRLPRRARVDPRGQPDQPGHGGAAARTVIRKLRRVPARPRAGRPRRAV